MLLSICCAHGRRISCPQCSIFNGSALHFHWHNWNLFFAIEHGNHLHVRTKWMEYFGFLVANNIEPIPSLHRTGCMWPHSNIFSTTVVQGGVVFQHTVLMLWPHGRDRTISWRHRSMGLEHIPFCLCPQGIRRLTVAWQGITIAGFPGQTNSETWPQSSFFSSVGNQVN